MSLILTDQSLEVLKARYLLRNDLKQIVESPQQLFRRVAGHIAKAEKNNPKEHEEKFLRLISSLDFLPNTPTLMNSGTRLGQLSACYVLPIEDSINSIFSTLKDMAIIQQSGGGTGFSFSKLRPKGDLVASTKGPASGPVSFMGLFDKATDVIKQGGKRRGANMGIINADHPDIFGFIEAKKEGFFRNFNLSIGATKKFMEAVKNNENFSLISPKTKKPIETVKAKKIFDEAAKNAWAHGDPGMIFLDEINQENKLKSLGMIECTNPCGEVPLYPYEACNLGSINLYNMISEGVFDWDKLKKTIRISIRFLDDVVTENNYPTKVIEEVTKANRKVGLGVMGFADMLISLGIPYNSEKALRLGEDLMKFVEKEAVEMSVELGEEKGSFPNFKKSEFAKDYSNMRNATVTSIAPTGTISIIAGVSSGIEPTFALTYSRAMIDVNVGFVNRLFEAEAKKQKIWSSKLMRKIAENNGSVRSIKEIPDALKEVFVTAHDIKPEYHVKMQAAFQKYTDNAVSKTVNLPNSATIQDVKKVFLLAYQLKCKGITVYRQGSKKEEVLKVCEVC